MERDAEIYWIAGFLEGEGCFGWYGDDRRPGSRIEHSGYPLVAASQNSREPLDRIAQTLPGPVRFNSITSAGNEHWEYRVTAKRAIDVMVAVFPLMSKRRQEAIKNAVAAYAEQAAQRIEVALFCPQGHPRDQFGSRRATGVGKGHQFCRECNRLSAAKRSAARRAEVFA